MTSGLHSTTAATMEKHATGKQSNDAVMVGGSKNSPMSSGSSLSNAISAAAATSTTQTRFSFYNAQEVEQQITSRVPPSDERIVEEEGNVEKSDGHLFSFYRAAARDEPVTTEHPQTQAQHQQQQQQKIQQQQQPRAQRNLLETAYKQQRGRNAKAGSATASSPKASKNQDAPMTGMDNHQQNNENAVPPPATKSTESTDEILRSLQETEEQRKFLLMGATELNSNGGRKAATPSSVPTPRIGSSSRAPPPITVPSQPQSVASNGDHQHIEKLHIGTGASGDGDSRNDSSNPYEDAIKEALNLLRRHRSPQASPQAQMTANIEPPSTVDVEPPTARDPAVLRPRTPREHDRVLRSRWDDSDDDDDDIENENDDDDEGGDNQNDDDNNNNSVGEKQVTSGQVEIDEDDLDIGPAAQEAVTAYQEAKLKARRRQERMAEYASRLKEFKSSLPAEMDPWKSQTTAPTVALNTQPINYQQNGIKQVATNDESVGLSDLSQSTKRDEEVQRGIERVLLAILERANNSRGRAEPEPDLSRELFNLSKDESAAPQSDSGNSAENALIRAMEDLLGPSSQNASVCASTSSSKKGQRADEGTEHISVLTGMSKRSQEKSVVDELLAEAESSFMEPPTPSSNIASLGGESNWSKNGGEEKKITEAQDYDRPSRRKPSEAVRYAEEIKSRLSKEDDSSSREISQNFSDMIDSVLRSSGNMGEEETIDDSRDEDIAEESGQSYTDDDDDEGDDDDDDDDDDDNHGSKEPLERVLGPLSKKAGGTTGVVLDFKNSSESDGSRSKTPPSILDSINNVMKDAENIISFVTGGKKDKADSNASQGSDVFNFGDSDQVDEEAMELMRTLCAHLLPYGLDEVSTMIDLVPGWDENNPNEAGYRIIRLSKSQLRRVERAFDFLISNVMRKSERRLNEVDSTGASANGYDDNFVRELQEAEKLLDDEEKRVSAAQANTTKQPVQKKSTRSADTRSSNHASAVPSHAGHPDFPGIKPAGKGEIGDLEYFHLPIIFKSHVTGFEPTKDLFLEPGNIVAGQYLVESELGSAAFSTAYRCVDLGSEERDNGHEEVCLKVIKNTKDFFDQSLDEIKILELLRQTGKCHENFIVEMKTFFYHREHLIIVTELLRQNLFEFGKFILDNEEEPYFTLPRLAYITRQVLIALRFVHSLGLVHSDVKPENILLGSYSRAQVKLIDFGSSCYLTDRQSSYIQSRSYRAPEVVLGLPYDGKIDIWSLGCVVAEMFTGEVTFQNDSIVSMLSRIEAICGPFPRHMIAQGRQSGRFFTKSGLLYESVADSGNDGKDNIIGDDFLDEVSNSAGDDRNVQYDIFQPKSTRLSSRLGFAADLMDDYTETKYSRNRRRRDEAMFTDFVGRMLAIDPDSRMSADEALRHPWMAYATSLTEESIKYPSS